MSDLGGVWRTVGGRRIFIKDGEDLKTAMDRSGKFKNSKVTDDEETHFNMKDLEVRVKETINEIENYYKKLEEFNDRKNTPEYKKQQKEFEQYIKDLINNR